MVWNLPQREEMDSTLVSVFRNHLSLNHASSVVGKLGNEGWSWERFHSYAKKVQRFCPPDPNERSEFKNLYEPGAVGYDGPVPLSFGRDSCGMDAAWQQACISVVLGYYGN